MNNNLIPALVIIGALLSILLIWFGFDREITREVYIEYVKNQNYEKTINECVFKINCDYYNNLLDKANFTKRKQIIADAARQGILIEDNGYWIAESERQVVNSIVQGSAADMTKRAMVALYRNEELNRLGFRLLMSVHDENIGECPKENVKRVTELLSEIMIAANNKCCVKMKCDAEVSEVWYGPSIDLKEVE